LGTAGIGYWQSWRERYAIILQLSVRRLKRLSTGTELLSSVGMSVGFLRYNYPPTRQVSEFFIPRGAWTLSQLDAKCSPLPRAEVGNV
jgi:hypothetical protein